MELTANDLNKTVAFKGLLKWENGQATHIRLLEDNSLSEGSTTHTLQKPEHDHLFNYFDQLGKEFAMSGVTFFIGAVNYVRVADIEGVKQWDFTLKVLGFRELGDVDYLTFVPDLNLADLLPK